MRQDSTTAITTTVAISFSHSRQGLRARALARRGPAGAGAPGPDPPGADTSETGSWAACRPGRAAACRGSELPGSISGIYCPSFVVVMAADGGRATDANLSSGQRI